MSCKGYSASWQCRRWRGLLAILGLTVVFGGVLLSSGDIYENPQNSARRDGDAARLVSITPLPEIDPEMCPWEPASAHMSRFGALQQQPARAVAAGASPKTVDFSQRQPARMIRDPYSAYSAVAVDPVNNEVVLTDENLFQILVYDRTTNTPPTARMFKTIFPRLWPLPRAPSIRVK